MIWCLKMLDFEISYRTTHQEISDRYCASPEAAFNDGNHAFAASIAAQDSEIYGISLILQGNVPLGLKVLEAMPATQESLFYRSLGNWFLGDGANCRMCTDKLLSTFDLSTFQSNCRELFAKDKINVLLMSREFSAVGIDSALFNIKTIGFTNHNDVVLSISDGRDEIVRKLGDIAFEPDFLFCFRPEYQLIPNQLQYLPFPKIAFVSDFDLHLYQKYDDFRRFDSLLVYSAADHCELSGIMDVPVFTHVFSHSISSVTAKSCRLPEEKKYDIHITGSSFKEFFSDKSFFLYKLSQLDHNYSIRIDDGFLSPTKYLKSLENTKIVPTYVRFDGCFPTRGIEALAHGTRILCQSGGVLEQFLEPEADGVHLFGPATAYNDANRALSYRNIEVDYKVRNKITKLWGKEASLTILMKFCAFLSMKIDVKLPISNLRNDYNVVGIGDLHGGIGGGLTGEDHCNNYNLLIAYNSSIKQSPSTINSSAILNCYRVMHINKGDVWNYNTNVSSLESEAIRLFMKGIDLYENHLVLRFNLARVLFHSGSAHESYKHFEYICDAYETMDFDPYQDDVMSALFFYESLFPYRRYINALIRSESEKYQTQLPRQIIASASYWYCSLLAQSSNDTDGAIRYGYRSIELFKDNHIAKKGLSKLLYERMKGGRRDLFSDDYVDLFEQSAGEYVLYLHDGLVEYSYELIARNDIDKLKRVLNSWFNFFSRSRINGFLFPVNTQFVSEMVRLQLYLPEYAVKIFVRCHSFFSDSARLGALDELEEAMLLSVFRETNERGWLWKQARKGTVIFTQPESYLIFAKNHALDGRIWQSLFCFITYLKHLDNGRAGVKEYIVETMEFTLEFKNKFLFLYMLVQKTRLFLCRLLNKWKKR